eukprot:377571-Heterocapsa_arctica.AAC.1
MDFANELCEWESALQRYVQATHYPMSDEVKCSIVSMNAPRAIQSYIRFSDVDLLESYAVLRRGVFKFLTRGRTFGNEEQLQEAPWELDA